MRLHVKEIISGPARETYVAVVAEKDPQPALAIFEAVAQAAHRPARLCRVRAFVPQHLMEQYLQAWATFQAGRPLTPVTWLHAGEGMPAAVQAHAIDAPGNWSELSNCAAGRAWP